MKKLFTLMAAALMAAGVQAQMISFGADDVCDKGKTQSSYSNGEFVLNVTDTDGKLAIDANNCYFGTAEAQQKFTHRLKTGGKSSSKNALSLTIPEGGTLNVYVRTGSNGATDRNVVLTQGGQELYNKVLLEADAVKVKGLDETDATKETNVYPVISVPVKAGVVNITYPVNGINFYAFELIGDGSGNTPSDPTPATAWNFQQELGAADAANLAADAANWTFDEDNNYWKNSAVLTERNVFVSLKANGAELELTKGLTFTRDNSEGLGADRVRISSGKFLALNGSKLIMSLGALVKDDVIRMSIKGAGESERSLTVSNAEVISGSLTTADTEEHVVELKVLADNLVTLTTGNGFQFMVITVNQTLEDVATAIQGVKTVSTENGAIYNLAGQKVSESFKGIAIKNGKKIVMK